MYQDSVLQDIELKVKERTERLEQIIRSRASKEKWITGLLTVVSLSLIASLYVKTQRGPKRVGIRHDAYVI